MDIIQKKLLALKNKGDLGEYNVYKALQDIDAKFLFNLYVPCGNSTSEIDLVLIHHTGLYVFECKNYRGKIYGKEQDEYWVTQCRKDSFSFYNPIKQNQGHINALKQYVDTPMYNIVVFSNTSILNLEVHNIVVQTTGVRKKIDEIVNISKANIDVDKIYNTLLPFSNVDESTKEQHITSLI